MDEAAAEKQELPKLKNCDTMSVCAL